MKDEITKVLTMMQEGKVNPEQATELIQALKESGTSDVTVTKGTEYLDKLLKVRVKSTEGDNVKVNVPLRLVKVALKTGLNIASAIPESAKYTKEIKQEDVEMILKAIDSEMTGPIVEINSQNGDQVLVTIE